MEGNNGTLQLIAKHLVRAIAPLRDAVSDLEGFQAFMLRIGWQVESLPPEYTALAGPVNDALIALDGLADGADQSEALALVEAVGDVYRRIRSIASAPTGIPPVDMGDFLGELAGSVFELLMVEYLAITFPAAYNALLAVGVIEFENVEPTATRPGFLAVRFRAGEISKVLSEPQNLPERLYGWGTADVKFNKLAGHLLEIFVALGLDAYVQTVDAELGGAFQDDIAQTDDPVEQMLSIPLLFDNVDEEEVEIGLGLMELPAEGTKPAGLILLPLIPSSLDSEVDIGADLKLLLHAGSDIADQLGVMFRGDDIEVRFPFAEGAELPEVGFGADLIFAPPDPVALLGEPGRTRLQVDGASLGLQLDALPQLELRAQLNVDGLTLIVGADSVDGFLAELFGGEDLQVSMPLSLGWSSRTGVSFAGGGGLVISRPIHLDAGPVVIQRFDASLTSTISNTAPPDLRVELAVSVAGQLGPLTFVAESIGLGLACVFREGNAGPFNVTTGFKPPAGLGLSVDGGGFKGGGFLRFEPELEQYSGILELEFQDQLTVKAIGLLSTRLPNGQSGFSLLIVISSEFTPIQLGFGFKLNGVGGLLGLNRTVRIDRLVSGLRDNTLNSILFPADVIANADRILSDLRQVFPPERGRFVFGPMAKITWGTPALLTADLGLIVEVPEPVRVAILGVVRGIVPSEQAAILRLQVNFLGVIDFEKEQFSFDASLFDSKLLAFTLTGDMAVRLFWGADANFLLTVGGFHPAYQPPPMNLPALRRLTLALLDGDNPRLTLETYVAVTSNTVQLGARLELYAAAWKFNAYGFLSFDVLFQLNPFYFVAEVTAMLALRVGTSSIAAIKLTLTLEGPTPWKARGDARLRLCWFLTVKVRFNKTFGEARSTTLPDLSVLPLLVEALSARDNWETELPQQRHRLESLRELSTTDQLAVHPVGTLRISQKVVPLNVQIDRLGSQRPADAREFAIGDVRVGPDTVHPPAAQESFAPAQLFDMTDEEKLASPSFQSFNSGIRVGDPNRLHTGYAAAREVKYELKYIDSQRDRLPPRPGGLFTVDPRAFNTWTLQGATAKSELSFARRRKSHLAPDEVGLVQESFAIVNTDDLTPFDAASVLHSEHAALKRREALIAANPALVGSLRVVPVFEMST